MVNLQSYISLPEGIYKIVEPKQSPILLRFNEAPQW